MSKLLAILFVFTAWLVVFGVLFGILYSNTPPEMIHNCVAWANLGIVAGAFLVFGVGVISR